MVNVSATGWTPQDAGRSLHFGRTRPRLLLCAFAEQPVVGMLNTLQVKTRHAAGASLRIRQDGEELFGGDIPAHAEIGIVPLTPAELVVSLTLEPGRVVHNFRIRPQVVAPEFSKIEVARQVFVGDSLPVVWDAPSATSVTLQIEDGDERSEHAGTSAGVFMLRPTRTGPILLRLVAQGPFATTVQTRTIQVVAPCRASRSSARFSGATREPPSLSTGTSAARARHSSKRRYAARLMASRSMAGWSSISSRRKRNFI
jgi:hypothetical protein